jgi:epsin
VEKIRSERRKAKANKNKYTGVGSDGGGFGGGSRYGGFGSDSLSGGGGYANGMDNSITDLTIQLIPRRSL